MRRAPTTHDKLQYYRKRLQPALVIKCLGFVPLLRVAQLVRSCPTVLTRCVGIYERPLRAQISSLAHLVRPRGPRMRPHRLKHTTPMYSLYLDVQMSK